MRRLSAITPAFSYVAASPGSWVPFSRLAGGLYYTFGQGVGFPQTGAWVPPLVAASFSVLGPFAQL